MPLIHIEDQRSALLFGGLNGGACGLKVKAVDRQHCVPLLRCCPNQVIHHGKHGGSLFQSEFDLFIADARGLHIVELFIRLGNGFLH